MGIPVQQVDYVVIGAGSAGAAVASRLSENGRFTVALLEAGKPDHFWTRIPVGFARLIENPAANWLYSSEPEAGTDLAALATQAVRDGDDYILNGTKVWTSYAQHADYCFVLARTDPSSRGTRGISIFLVPTELPGFEIEPLDAILDA